MSNPEDFADDVPEWMRESFTPLQTELLRSQHLHQLAQPVDCDSCSWETEVIHPYDAYAIEPKLGPMTPQQFMPIVWLCDVCSSTLVGRAHQYPRNFDATFKELGPVIAWGINRIIQEIKDATSVRTLH